MEERQTWESKTPGNHENENLNMVESLLQPQQPRRVPWRQGIGHNDALVHLQHWAVGMGSDTKL